MAQYDVTHEILHRNTPRKKKRYILYLYTAKSKISDIKTIEKVVGVSLKEFILVHLSDPDEALKLLLLKNIEIIIIDEAFLPNEEFLVEFAHEMKKRKKCGIFFITTKEEKLIKEYKFKMMLYDESDDYILSPVDFIEAGKKLKKISSTPVRAAKRFSLNFDTFAYRLNNNFTLQCKVHDISLVGVSVIIDKDEQIKRNEYLRIKIPLINLGIFHSEYGDFFYLTIKIQRLSIDGTLIGGSIEYLTPKQNECLITILEVIAKRMRLFKNKTK